MVGMVGESLSAVVMATAPPQRWALGRWGRGCLGHCAGAMAFLSVVLPEGGGAGVLLRQGSERKAGRLFCLSRWLGKNGDALGSWLRLRVLPST